MLKEISEEEATGKSIRMFLHSLVAQQLVIIFSDDTFTTFGLARGYEPHDDYIETQDLRLLDFGDEALIQSQIVTKEELETHRLQWRKTHETQRELQERREYERLKAKFGPNPVETSA